MSRDSTTSPRCRVTHDARRPMSHNGPGGYGVLGSLVLVVSVLRVRRRGRHRKVGGGNRSGSQDPVQIYTERTQKKRTDTVPNIKKTTSTFDPHNISCYPHLHYPDIKPPNTIGQILNPTQLPNNHEVPSLSSIRR